MPIVSDLPICLGKWRWSKLLDDRRWCTIDEPFNLTDLMTWIYNDEGFRKRH